MAWKYTLNLQPEWGEVGNEPTLEEIQFMSKVVADRLTALKIRSLNVPDERTLQRIIDRFRLMADNENEATEILFNTEMDRLYDLADEIKLWVNTF